MTDEALRVIGLIADTHGLVRPDVHTALAGVELIIHAGDVGGDEVFTELDLIAPVVAVRGNTDPPSHPRLPVAVELEIGGLRVHVSHGHELGAPTPDKLFARYTTDVIVFGHTHRPVVVNVASRWAINPGAAGPRRFDILPSVGRMTIRGGQVEVEIVDLRI